MSLVYIYSSSMNYNTINYLEDNLNILKSVAKNFIFAFPSSFYSDKFNAIIDKCGIINKFWFNDHYDCNNNDILGFSNIYDNNGNSFNLKDSLHNINEILSYSSIILFNCDFILLKEINEINYGNFECNTILGKNKSHFYQILTKFTCDGLIKYLISEDITIRDCNNNLLYNIVPDLYINSIFTDISEIPMIKYNDSLSKLPYDNNNSCYNNLKDKYNNTARINKNLTIYVYYNKPGFQKNETNFEHFLKYGLEINNMDYIIVLHSFFPEKLIPIRENVEIIYEDNCQDFEAWYNVLINKEWFKYDHIFFLNCSILGPLNFDGLSNIIINWDIPYLDKLKEDKAVCCSNTIEYLNSNHPGGEGYRCSTYIFCVNTIVMPLLLTQKISGHINGNMKNFYYNSVFSQKTTKMDTILTGEFGLSRVLLENNYKITCLHPNMSDRGELKMTLFMKNNWIDGNNRACPPCSYCECMNIIKKEIDRPPEDYDFNNLDISETGKCHSDSNFNWISKKDFYYKFGYSEEIILI